MILVGDIHGKFDKLYPKIIKSKGEQICQVGDLGVGFPTYDYPEDFGSSFKFIRGNHDNPEICSKHMNYLGDWGYSGNIFYFSGAESRDTSKRIMGLDWWKEEELSYREAGLALDYYKEIRPDYVISHDCPASITKKMFPYCSEPKSITSILLQMAFEFWRPKAWFFGHYHQSKKYRFEGTNFYCLGTYQQFSVPNLYLTK